MDTLYLSVEYGIYVESDACFIEPVLGESKLVLCLDLLKSLTESFGN